MCVGIDHEYPGCRRAGRKLLEVEWLVDPLESLCGDRSWFKVPEVRPLVGFPEMSQDRLSALGPFRMAIMHPVLIVSCVTVEREHAGG